MASGESVIQDVIIPWEEPALKEEKPRRRIKSMFIMIASAMTLACIGLAILIVIQRNTNSVQSETHLLIVDNGKAESPTKNSGIDKSRLRPSDAPTVSPLNGKPKDDPFGTLFTSQASSDYPSFPSANPSSTPACSRVYAEPPPLPGKKGAGMILADEGKTGSWVENLPKIILLRPYWNYNWGLERIDEQPDDIEFVPMLWGGRNKMFAESKLLTDLVPSIQNGTIKRLFGFNEPDLSSQADMPYRRALNLWHKLEDMNLPLASPSCAYPAGEWMRSFMANATETCKRVDWVGVHWYGGPNFKSFQNDMLLYHKLYGLPIVITEFAAADWGATTVEDNQYSPETVLDFMKQALPWLEQQEWVAGYAWFNFQTTSVFGTSSALFDAGGKLNALGRFYASVRTNRPRGDQTIEFE